MFSRSLAQSTIRISSLHSVFPAGVTAEVEHFPGSDVIHGVPGGPDEFQDVIHPDEVADAKGEKVGVRAVHEEVDDASGHPLVALLNEVGFEIVVELARHRIGGCRCFLGRQRKLECVLAEQGCIKATLAVLLDEDIRISTV